MRLSVLPERIMANTNKRFSVETQNARLGHVVQASLDMSWARDPFDRLIVAQAKIEGAKLISADAVIQKHYKLAMI